MPRQYCGVMKSKQYIFAFLLSVAAAASVQAQEPCNFGSFEASAKELEEAKSCETAAARMNDCAWGSSADAQLAPIVITKCEKRFFDKLSPAAKKQYAEEMQLCAYEFAWQEGTLYMSAAALCQVNVAARFAGDPAAASQATGRPSFDCHKAQTPLERAICSDVKLGHADIVLSRVYSRTLQNSEGNDKSVLLKSEKQWLKAVPVQCGLSGPPFSEKSLNCIRNEFEDRFETLDACQEGIAWCLREENVRATAPSTATPRASFDCEKPVSALELVICADAELGQLDIQLAQAYRDASTIMAGEQHKGLAESEREWLRFVNKTCPLGAVGGIPSVIARSCVRASFQTRISQLQTCPKKELQARTPCLNEFRLLEKKPGAQ